MAVLPPCDVSWATVADVLSNDCNNGPCADLDPYVLQQALDDASFLLNAWSAFQYNGPCEATVRPAVEYGPALGVPQWVAPPGGVAWGMWPFYSGGVSSVGAATNWGGWGFCGGACRYPLTRQAGQCGGGYSAVGLGAFPVTDILEVLIDGVALDDDEYRVDDQRWLVRVDPDGGWAHWPCCTSLTDPTDSTDHHTWEVTFTYGQTPPPTAVRAAIDLGCMLAQQRCSGDCTSFPSNITQMNREGVTVALVRPSEDALDNMPLSVRSFIDATNPKGLRRRPRIMSPELPREIVQTTWP